MKNTISSANRGQNGVKTVLTLTKSQQCLCRFDAFDAITRKPAETLGLLASSRGQDGVKDPNLMGSVKVCFYRNRLLTPKGDALLLTVSNFNLQQGFYL